MITLTIEGTPLYIPEDTTLVLEQSNNIFETDGITTDIVWQFEIPAEPNAKVLGNAKCLTVGNSRRYPCELMKDSVVFSLGEIYIQSSIDDRTLQCGIVANAFGIGFGEQKMSDTSIANDIVIAESQENHRQGWKNFLKSTLNTESALKFFLFAAESFYRDNEDFGYHYNKPSGIDNLNTEDQFTQYVNRLFFDSSENIIDNPDKDAQGNIVAQGLRIFNTACSGKQNGYCFAPAIRLDWLVRRLLASTGMQVSGNFFANKDIHQLFLQSLNALDGDVFQYGVDTWLEMKGNITTGSATSTKGFPFKYGDNSATSFIWGSNVEFAFKILVPRDELTRNQSVEEELYELYDEIFALAVTPANGALPSIRMQSVLPEGDGTYSYFYGRYPTIDEMREHLDLSDNETFSSFASFQNGNATCNCTRTIAGVGFNFTKTGQFYTSQQGFLVPLTASKSKNVYYTNGDFGGYVEGSVKPRIQIPGVQLTIRLVKVKVYTTKSSGPIRLTNAPYRHTAHVAEFGLLEELRDYEILDTLAIDSTDVPLNIYSKILKWSDHMPDLTKGEFLSLICQTFGLSLFANPVTREVQLNFFADTLKGDSFDISQWVSKRERLEYEPKRTEVSFSSVLGTKEVNEKNLMPSVLSKSSLPIAAACKNKHVFVENEKAFRRSTKENNTSRFSWEQAGGDNRKLVAGCMDSNNTSTVEISCGMTNMRWVEEKNTPHYLCEVPTSGCSSLMDEAYDGKFDMVLMQYRGRRTMNFQTTARVEEAFFEDANPTIFDMDGNNNQSGISLAASGSRSIGEKWLKPVYDMIGNNDRYRITAYLPSWAWMKVMATLQPQNGAPFSQTRYIYVDGIKMLPAKISSELSSKDSVICTIEGVSQHIEV